MLACAILALGTGVSLHPQGGDWTRLGPYNIFNGNSSRYWGEAGTLASAASPKTNPNLIYAGGQNNGVSSGVIRTTDAGLHWERKSRGLWDTAVSAVWVHPDDPWGAHVFAGTHSGVYESVDAAETWARCARSSPPTRR